MRLAMVVLSAAIVGLVGVLLGAWWTPFLAGAVIGVVAARPEVAVPLGAAVGLLSWALPLAAIELRYGLGSTASSLAAIMGFGHQGAVPVILTLVVGLLLGLTGAWVAGAARGVIRPAAR